VELMKKRSRAGGEPIKGRPPKMSKPSRRNATKTLARPNSPLFVEQKAVARLSRDRDKTIEQLSAASEVLKVITSSPGDLKLVFEAILENATRLHGHSL
jgi:hypothetical protein